MHGSNRIFPKSDVTTKHIMITSSVSKAAVVFLSVSVSFTRHAYDIDRIPYSIKYIFSAWYAYVAESPANT